MSPLTGWVPEILPYLLQSSLYIAPLRIGSGTRLKLLEAMAAQCAIVATTTAASGLGSSISQFLTLADKPQEFANAVLELLQDIRLNGYESFMDSSFNLRY